MGVLTAIKRTMALVTKKSDKMSVKRVGSEEYSILQRVMLEKKESYIRIEARLMFYKQLLTEMDERKDSKEEIDMITEDVGLLENVRATLEAELEKMAKKMDLLLRKGYATTQEHFREE